MLKLTILIMRLRYSYIKQIMKLNSQLTQCSIITLEKNSIKNKTQKQFESTRVNSLSIIPDS
jgi:hypothetical protein